MSLFVSKEMNSRETLLHFGQECGKPASTFRDQLEAVMILRVQIIDDVVTDHIRLKKNFSFAFSIKNLHKVDIVFSIHDECVIYFILVL